MQTHVCKALLCIQHKSIEHISNPTKHLFKSLPSQMHSYMKVSTMLSDKVFYESSGVATSVGPLNTLCNQKMGRINCDCVATFV